MTTRDRPHDVEPAPATETIRRRAYRFGLPVVVVATAAIWWVERLDGFPHVVDQVGIPTLFATYFLSSLAVWLRPGWLRATERTILAVTLAFFVAAVLASAAVGRLDDQLLGLNGYLPMIFAVAFLILGPGAGAVASLALYGAFATIASWGIATDALTLGEAMPMYVGTGMVLALLYAVARSAAASARHQARMELEAATDTLTGALNRRGALSVLDRQRGAFALLVIDLDHFKDVNDRFGHTRGDEALVRAVSEIEADLRPRDLIARWGGDEFVIIAPGADEAAARSLAQRVRIRVRDAGASLGVRLEASVGVAARADDEPWTAAFDRADAAMYEAKGRRPPSTHADRRG